MSSIRLISLDQLQQLPPTEIISGTRLVARGLNVVFGPSGAFKSFYTLDAALTIAQSASVVYVAAEGAGGLFKRVSAWCEYNALPAGQIHFICEEVNLLEPACVAALIKLIKPVNPENVIFDTLARCIPGGDENSAKDMGLVVRNSALIQRQVDTAITWIHHSNRAERGERGSGAIRGAADAMIELSASGDGIIRLSCSKLKDDEPWEPEELRFYPAGNSGVLVPSDSGLSSNLSAIELRILNFLALEIFDPSGARANQIVNALGVAERTVYHTLSHLKRELQIVHDNKGDPYRITELGKDTIRKRSAKSSKPVNVEVKVDDALLQ